MQTNTGYFQHSPFTYNHLKETYWSRLNIQNSVIKNHITKNCGKFLERWEYQTTLPASWETCMQVKKQQLELDMEQQTGSKLGKEYVKAAYFHPAYSSSPINS